MGSGYRKDLENMQSLAAGAVPYKATETIRLALKSDAGMPDEVLRSGRGWKIRNQQYEGSCTGHMIAAAGEDLVFIDSGEVVEFSPDFSYYTAQARCGLLGRDDGATIEAACESGMQDGFVFEKDLPYTPEYNPRSVTAAVKALAKGRIKRRSIPRGPNDWRTWTATGQGGTLLGVPWTRNLQRYDGNGIVNDLGSTSGVGWHAIYACGFSLLMIDGEIVFEIKNSHSEAYGRKGFLYIGLRVANQMIDAGATQVSVSDVADWENPVVRSPVRMADPFLGMK